jgi:hypothetical protein
VYAGVGWVLLEVADVAFPRLGLPDWTEGLFLLRADLVTSTELL